MSYSYRRFHPRRRLRRRRQGGERSFRPRLTPPPSMRECGCRESWPSKPHPTLLDASLATLMETLPPLRGERQDRRCCRRCCPQLAWISHPSLSTGTRTTSRIGGGFSSSGGLRPRAVRMRCTEISSLTYATTFSFPPHWR